MWLGKERQGYTEARTGVAVVGYVYVIHRYVANEMGGTVRYYERMSVFAMGGWVRDSYVWGGGVVFICGLRVSGGEWFGGWRWLWGWMRAIMCD